MARVLFPSEFTLPFHEAAHLGDLGRWLGHGAAATTDVLASQGEGEQWYAMKG